MQTRLSELPPCSRVNTYILARSRKKVFLPRGNPAETECKPVGILTGYETQKHFMTALNGARNSLLTITRCATAISIAPISINGRHPAHYLFYRPSFRCILARSTTFEHFESSSLIPRPLKLFKSRSDSIYCKLVRQIVSANYYFQSYGVIEASTRRKSTKKICEACSNLSDSIRNYFFTCEIENIRDFVFQKYLIKGSTLT